MDYFLTIAASDNSGGAGIQQDIKVAHDLDYWALSAVTGITVQNFKNVSEIEAVEPWLLKSQIEQCFRSFEVKTVKIGAVCSRENLKVIGGCLKQFSPKHVVIDPVLFSTGG
ncbi:MAG: bifunctional hydroxymethylpyrimidine kinase/phosphomethylpyrimidine kinase, partial [Bacteroidota bacterium]